MKIKKLTYPWKYLRTMRREKYECLCVLRPENILNTQRKQWLYLICMYTGTSEGF